MSDQEYINYQYFLQPVADAALSPTCKVWYPVITRTPERVNVTWTDQPPVDGSEWVVGATQDSDLPKNALLIVPESTKCVPPPPFFLPPDAANLSDMQRVLRSQLDRRMDDEPMPGSR